MEIQLSKRLQAVVELVTKGSSVADIGCDHAYVSIYMLTHQIVDRVIAMDVNAGPLERARENIKKFQVEDRIQIRQSNGIEQLQPGEVQTLLLAGMGGALMQKILQGKASVLDQVTELIVQPQSEIPEFRRFLEQIGFRIEQENMIKEDGKYYVMMKAVRNQDIPLFETEVFYQYGKYLLENKNETTQKYLEKEQKMYRQICDKIQSHPSERNEERIATLKKQLILCEEALRFYED